MEKYTSVSVSKRARGWQARLRYKEGNDWKELSRMLPEAKGKKEAEKMAEDLRRSLNEVADQEALRANQKTVEEVVLDYLAYQFSIGELESSSYSKQLQYFNSGIKPYLGDYVFETLDRTAIIDWHTKLAKKGLKQSTIYVYYQVLSKVYNYYLTLGEIGQNPFKQVKVLHSKSKNVRVTHLTAPQMEKFLNSVFAEYEPKDAMYAGLLLAFFGALRRSEILGLRWYDINFKMNTLSVSSAVSKGLGGAYTKGPKNRSSIRTFPMIPQLAQCLKLRYDAIQPKDNWFVVSDNQDKFMSPTQFSYRARRFYDAYELVDAYGNPLSTHALRHNAATVGMRADMDIAALSLMMGHANRAMTLNVYGDANKESKKIAMERLSKAFSKDTKDEDYFDNLSQD